MGRSGDDEFLPVIVKRARNSTNYSLDFSEDIVESMLIEELEGLNNESLGSGLEAVDSPIELEQVRALEKEFLVQAIEIIPFLMMLFLIFSLSSRHAYLDPKLEFNENVKFWMQNKTNWNSVSLAKNCIV